MAGDILNRAHPVAALHTTNRLAFPQSPDALERPLHLHSAATIDYNGCTGEVEQARGSARNVKDGG